MDINLIENIIKNLNNKEKIDNKEELETLITDLHRIKNDIFDLNNKNEELNNRFGLFWKEVPEKMIKNISENEIVYGKSLYSFVTKIENGEGKNIKANINGEEIKLTRQADSYLFKDSKNDEFLIYSNSLYKFSKETQEEYIPILKEKGDGFFIENNNDNILIEGDNYYALQMLQYTHKEKIDLICIDPPYNTGKKDFKYNDRFIKTEDGDRHSSWLSFMKKRLILAEKLMSENSVICINIDENEVDNLSLLMKGIFGEKNVLNKIIWSKGNAQNDSEYIQKNHEYILIAIKSKPNISFTSETLVKVIQDEKNRFYFEGSGIVTGGEGGTLNSRKKLGYSICFNKKTNESYAFADYDLEKATFLNKEEEVYFPPNNEIKNLLEKGFVIIRPPKKNKGKTLGAWTWSIEKFNKEKDSLLFKYNKRTNSYSIKKKSFVSENKCFKKGNEFFFKKEKQFPLKSILNISSSEGTKEIQNLFNSKVFNNTKPIELLKYLINSIKKTDTNILDFFAGSGTTGQAVWDLNKEDNGNRKFILCTNNENNICEDVTFERLKRANEKYEYNESLKYLTINHVSEKVLRKEDNRGQFETLKEIVNLKYNSFKIIEENEEWYVNENIAILKDFDYLEEFKQKFSNHEYLGLVTNEEAEWNIFKEKLISIKKEDNLTQFSSSYMSEIRKVIKGQY